MKLLSLLFCVLCSLSSLSLEAAQLTINLGAAANDGTGDTLRSAFGKVNTNFSFLFTNQTASDARYVAMSNGLSTNQTFYGSPQIGDGTNAVSLLIKANSSITALGGSQILLNGDFTRSELLTHGTNAFIRFDTDSGINDVLGGRLWKFNTAPNSNNVATLNEVTNTGISLLAGLNSFIFISSSLTRETPSSSSQGYDYPQLLLSQPNYGNHSQSWNLGVTASTLADWTASLWSTMMATPTWPATNRILMFEGGVNDCIRQTPNATNNWSNICVWARSSNMLIYAFTIATNTTNNGFYLGMTNNAQLAYWSNFNQFIINSSNMYDALIRVDLLLTNIASQTVDGLHWSPSFNANLSQYINTNAPPPLSKRWAALNRAYESWKVNSLEVTNQWLSRHGLQINGPGLAHIPVDGALGEITFESGNTFQILSFDYSANTWRELVLSGNNISLYPHNGARVISFGDMSFTGWPRAYYAGASSSGFTNCPLLGSYYANITGVVNAGTAETNLITTALGASSMQSNGDTYDFWLSGKFSLTGQSKQLKAYLGSSVFADTGSQSVSNSSWTIRGQIVRTSGTAQYYNAYLSWGPGPFSTTNWSGAMAENLALSLTFKLTGTAGVTSCITNEFARLNFFPASTQ